MKKAEASWFEGVIDVSGEVIQRKVVLDIWDLVTRSANERGGWKQNGAICSGYADGRGWTGGVRLAKN